MAMDTQQHDAETHTPSWFWAGVEKITPQQGWWTLLVLGVLLLVFICLTAYWSGNPWVLNSDYANRSYEQDDWQDPTGFWGFWACHMVEGNSSENVLPFLLRHLLSYLPYFVALLLVFLVPLGKKALPLILIVAVIGRVVMLAGDVILETDILRAMWEGRMLVHGFNPYLYTPQEVIDAANGFNRELYTPQEWNELLQLAQLASWDHEADWEQIVGQSSNKRMPSMNPPLAQVLFAFSNLINPGSPWVMKGLVTAFDLGVIVMILLILARIGFDMNRVIVYAWSPLVMKEFANTGHYEPMGIFFLLVGLYWVIAHSSARMVTPTTGDRTQVSDADADGVSEDGPLPPKLLIHTTAPVELEVTFSGWSWLASLWIGLGALVKPVPLIALPVTLTRISWRGVLLFQVVLLLGVLLFLPGTGRFLEGTLIYLNHWEFNSSLVAFTEYLLKESIHSFSPAPQYSLPDLMGPYSPVQTHFSIGPILFSLDPFFLAKFILALVFFEVLLYFLMHPAHSNVALLRQVYIGIGVWIMCSPVASPWYLCWLVPFLCLFPNIAWLYLTFAINAYYCFYLYGRYLTWGDWGVTGVWSEWESVRVLQYLPFYILLTWLTVSRWRYYRAHQLQYLRDHAQPLPLKRMRPKPKPKALSFPLGP